MKVHSLQQDDYSYDVTMCEFDNFFNIYDDKNGKKRYNINETLYLNVMNDALKTYKVKHDTQWSIISYELYSIIDLAWLLCKINDVKFPMETVVAGTEIKYIPQNRINTILEYING